MELKFLEITKGLAWQIREAVEKRERLPVDAYEVNGILYWKSNDRPVPVSFFKEAFIELPAVQKEACEKSDAAFIAAYKKSMAGKPVSAEERYEARAAHGPGVTLVNVITGRKFTT